MKKRLYESVEGLNDKTEAEATLQDQIHLKMWNNPLNLTQEITKELHEIILILVNIKNMLKLFLIILVILGIIIFFKI